MSQKSPTAVPWLLRLLRRTMNGQTMDDRAHRYLPEEAKVELERRRQEELRKAMERKAAEEAASKWSRE